MAHSRICAAAALLILASPAVAEGWRSYRNARFGATADAPADWRPLPPPENGDGQTFESPDGRATLTISGILAIDPIADELAGRANGSPGETVAYRKTSASSVVVSGVKGDRIFYRRSIAGCRGTIVDTVSFDYPAADKARYDALVSHVAASLRAGPGWMCKQEDGAAPR